MGPSTPGGVLLYLMSALRALRMYSALIRSARRRQAAPLVSFIPIGRFNTLGVQLTPWNSKTNTWETDNVVFVGTLQVTTGGDFTVGGKLEMLGTWWNLFGCEYIHIFGAQVGMSLINFFLILQHHEFLCKNI